MEIFAKRLREQRKGKGWTQVQTAVKLDIPQRTYSNYEIQKGFPPPELLVDIAKLFGVSIDYLMGNADI